MWRGLGCGIRLAKIFVLTFFIGLGETWQQNLPAKNVFRYGNFNQDQIFHGNRTATDYFKILFQDETTALIGSRNVLYNISLDTMKENHRYEWNYSEAALELCQVKSKTQDECQNYIRVAYKRNDEELFVCGTNSYSPKCRVFNLTSGTSVQGVDEIDGSGRCPFGPLQNSTFIYAGDQLYSGAVADFSGGDSLIYKQPMRTERLDFKQLNDANFVSSLEYKEYIFFFFREIAVEYINCGKAIYSRVARVCKHDKGGPPRYSDRWTSFLKARLNCSIPGEYPFYFDEIQGTSDIVLNTSLSGIFDPVVYGVFNTPVNAISGSAVCMFNMTEVINTFTGSFKDQKAMDSNWLPVKNVKIADHTPGMCVEDSRLLPDLTVNFVKSHSLMDDAVPALFSKPIFTRISIQSRLTSIAVDNRVADINRKQYDILFLGTDDGRLVKIALYTNANGSTEFINVEEINLEHDAKPLPVKTLNIIKSVNGKPGKIVATFDQHIISVPLSRCNNMTTCQACVDMKDPYCAWDGSACVNHLEANDYSKTFVQAIQSSHNDLCGPTNKPSDNNSSPKPDDSNNSYKCDNEIVINGPTTPPSAFDKPVYVSLSDAIGLMMMMCALIMLIVGFAAGFIFSRYFRHNAFPLPLHPFHPHNRLADMNGTVEIGTDYVPNNKEPFSFLKNMTKDKNDCTLEKNLDTSVENKTLQKVKKTYI